MKHKTIKKHKLIFLLIVGAILVLTVSVAVLIGTGSLSRISAVNFISKDGTEIEFDKEFSLPVGREVILDDDGKSVSIKVTELHDPDTYEEPDSCRNPKINSGVCLPPTVIRISVEVAGYTFWNYDYTKYSYDTSGGGRDPYRYEPMSMGSSVDIESMNFNYNIFPYNIRVTGGDLPNYATLMISKKNNYKKVSLGEEFTLTSNTLVELELARTGLEFRGFSRYMNQEVDISRVYIDRLELDEVPEQFVDTRGTGDLDRLTKGDVIEHKNTRLRVVDSDGETYATLVFEKIQ